jgi:hypothetical protein
LALVCCLSSLVCCLLSAAVIDQPTFLHIGPQKIHNHSYTPKTRACFHTCVADRCGCCPYTCWWTTTGNPWCAISHHFIPSSVVTLPILPRRPPDHTPLLCSPRLCYLALS